MKCNVGGVDRAARLVAGIVILSIGQYTDSWWGLVGVIPVLTALFRFCPVYVPFGFSTCKPQEGPRE